MPRPCVLCKGGWQWRLYDEYVLPSGLHRTYGAHHLHFITCSCYRRSPFLRTASRRSRFLSILEQTRQRYHFVVLGYVVMPEHIHLLITEQWRWSSYRFYFLDEAGPVRVNEGWSKISFRAPAA